MKAMILLACMAWSWPALGQAEWATAVSKHPTANRAIVFRFVRTFPAGFSRADQPDRIILTWRYRSETGMPSMVERQQMDKLEDLLLPIVNKERIATLVLVSTGENLKEWTYYAKSESAFLSRLNEALKGDPRFPVEIHAAPDPAWTTYERFRQGMKE